MFNIIIPNAFTLSGILLGVTCTILLAFLLVYEKTKVHKIWICFNLAVAIWGYSAFFIGKTASEDTSVLIWKLAFIGVLFIPVFFYHFCCLFAKVNRSLIILFAYSQGIFFLILNCFTTNYISQVELLWGSIYYLKSTGLFFPISFCIWLLLVVLGHFELISQFRNFQGSQRNQVLYFFTGFFVGFLGGTTNFFPMFGLTLYPYGNFTVSLYCVLLTYAILKYRLLDIKIVFTRTGSFLAVYSLVLGIPFAIAFGCRDFLIETFSSNWWMIPLISSTLLATLGPSIYLFIQKKAEDKLLQEQRQYQSTLRQASLGMGRVKDLKKLLNLIVHIIVRAVKIQHSAIYLLHDESKQFTLRATKGQNVKKSEISAIPQNANLIKFLEKIKEPIVYEEIRQRSQDYGDENLKNIEQMLNDLDAELIVPSFIEERLIALILFGKKNSGRLYSQDDLAVFSILANQSALAIENAQFYEDMKRTHEQLFKAEKMATIGTMADGLSHQINNRLHAMGFIAGDALDSIRLKKKSEWPVETKGLINDVEYALERIEENVKRGGEIVEGLLKYTRKGEEGFTAIDLNKLINAAIEMLQFKIKLKELDIVRNFNEGVPQVKGNFTQLQEVVFNIIDNSYDAIMQRKTDLNEINFHGRIDISVIPNGQYLEFTFKDNGIGVKKDDIGKLFTPFFTTKLSSKKGTGLGLYVIRQIIEENHGGKVIFTSDYRSGAQTKLVLPIYTNSK